MAIGRRIEDDALVGIAPFRFAARELQGVFNDPADPVEPAGFHVAPCPGDDLADRIQVGDVGSGGLGGQGSGARVGEQVEDFRCGPAFCAGRLRQCFRIPEDVLPVRSLLRKDADVLERGQAEPQAEIQTRLESLVADVPLVFHLPGARPGTAVLLAGLPETGTRGEAGVDQAVPLLVGQGLVPQGLRFRPCHDIAAETLQFLKIAAVQDLIILPRAVRVFDFHACNLNPRQRYRFRGTSPRIKR